GVDGPLVMLEDPYAYVVAAFQAPLSPDYVSGPKYPPSPDFVPELVYPEFMPQEDELLPDEEQLLPAALSPIADLPGYVPESDPDEDPEEDDDDKDPEEDPADYNADRGDDGDDEDELSDDDEDDDVDIEGDEEEEEHPAPADSIVIDESAATPPPHPAYRVTARISIRDEPPTPFWSDIEVARLLAIPIPPPSPLSPWSSQLPQIPSPPLPAPSTSHSLSPHIILSHTRAETPPSGTSPFLPIPAPTSSPYLLLPSADHKADRPEVCLPPWKRLCFAFGPRKIMRDLERDVSYEITDTWDEMLVDMPGAPSTDDTYLGRQMNEFTTRVRQDTDEIYTRDRRAHACTALLMEREARMSRKAWGRSMDASDLARSEVMSLHTTILGQQAVIIELQAADRRKQAAITELLAADRRRQAQFIEALKLLKALQTQMTEFQKQQGPAKCPAQPDTLEEASSSS
ncbi:hypothetical protein Tco_1128976, partial [Tanacetum coccineum]